MLKLLVVMFKIIKGEIIVSLWWHSDKKERETDKCCLISLNALSSVAMVLGESSVAMVLAVLL